MSFPARLLTCQARVNIGPRLLKDQAVTVTLKAASAIANNDAFVNNKVLSATSDSSIYVTRIVNHCVNCIL